MRSENYIQVHTGIRDYLIKFNGSNEKFIFNNAKGLLELLKTKNRYSFDYIKVFDPVKLRFKRIALKDVKRFLSYNTELDLDFFSKMSEFKNL